MPTSAGSLPDVCPAHVATTQSGVYAMNHASVKLSVVPDLEATSRVMPSCHCLLYCRRTPVTPYACCGVITVDPIGGLALYSTAPAGLATRVMEVGCTADPPSANAAYAAAWSSMRTAELPMAVLALSARVLAIPSECANLRTFSGPAFSITSSVGTLRDRSKACHAGISPMKLPSQSCTPFRERDSRGVSSTMLDMVMAPSRSACSYTYGLNDEPGRRSAVTTLNSPAMEALL